MAHHLVCFLLCAFYIQCISLQVRTVWKPVIVSNSSLQNTTLITKQANASVDVACSIIATRRPWAKLFCIVGEHCILSSFLAVPYPSQVPIADPVECMTNIDGCLYNEMVPVTLGDWYCPTELSDMNAPYHCVEGVLIPAVHPPSKERCPDTFKKDPKYGCLLAKTTPATFCNARATCLKMESDLYSFDKLTSTTEITHFQATLTPNCYIHAGFTKKGINFQWFNGKSLLQNSTLWHSAFKPCSPSINPSCGQIYSNDGYTTYGLGCVSCNLVFYNFVCQIDIPN